MTTERDMYGLPAGHFLTDVGDSVQTRYRLTKGTLKAQTIIKTASKQCSCF
jgi:hypothetical protein